MWLKDQQVLHLCERNTQGPNNYLTAERHMRPTDFLACWASLYCTGVHFLHWKGTQEASLSHFVHWKETHTLSHWLCWKDALEGSLSHLLHQKGTLEGTLSCLIYHRGTFWAFFSKCGSTRVAITSNPPLSLSPPVIWHVLLSINMSQLHR